MRLLYLWITLHGDIEFVPEKMVQKLMKERRDKVEEIKKKTNYYSTRDLIQRYDEPSPATPLRARINLGQTLPVTPQNQPFPNNINGKASAPAVTPALQAQLSRALISFRPPLIDSFFSQLPHLLSPYDLNGGNGTIGSLTPSWATTIPIWLLQVLAMP